MRIPILLVLTLFCFPTIYSKTKPILEDKGSFGFQGVDDSIYLHKYLETENQLLLVGYRNLQLIDLTNFKVIETRPIDLPYSDLQRGDGYRNWAISPDGKRIVLTGLKAARTKTKTQDTQSAWVVDLQTGKRIGLLQHPDKILLASWSRNGKTL